MEIHRRAFDSQIQAGQNLHRLTQPGDGVKAEPGDGVRAEPIDGVRAEPSAGVRAEPGDGVKAEPSDGVKAEPGDGVKAEPSDGVMAEPGDGVKAEPADRAKAEPVDGVEAEPRVSPLDTSPSPSGRMTQGTARLPSMRYTTPVRSSTLYRWPLNTTSSDSSMPGGATRNP